jgi:hypothetical protein
MLASEPEQRKRAQEATTSEILGKASPHLPIRQEFIFLALALDAHPRSLGSYSISECDIGTSLGFRLF